MNRRSVPVWLIALGAALVVVVVAVVAFAAGAASNGFGDGIGRFRDVMPRMMIGSGWFGWAGWGIGWLVFLALIVGVVWLVVSLMRPSEPGPPPPGWTPPTAPPEAGPPSVPPPGSVEAFEAWHRQAHAGDHAVAHGHPETPAAPPQPNAEPPGAGPETGAS